MIQPMIVYPDIDPIIFSIGVVKIRWYGLMYVAGFCSRGGWPENAQHSRIR